VVATEEEKDSSTLRSQFHADQFFASQRVSTMVICELGWLYYVWSCGLQTVPIFVCNLAFTCFLPSALGSDEFWRETSPLVAHGENSVRCLLAIPNAPRSDDRCATTRQNLIRGKAPRRKTAVNCAKIPISHRKILA
jgi:hypothetical protein